MTVRIVSIVAVLLVSLLTLVSPGQERSTGAQMGPMMGGNLEQLSGDAFDRAWLMQMIMHHMMAVQMSEPLAANAVHEEARALANGIIADQTREIELMRGWLKAWFGADMPGPMMGTAPGQTPTAMGPGAVPGHGGPMGPGPMMGPTPGQTPGAMGPGAMPGPGGPMGQGTMMGGQGQGGHGMSMMADLWKLPSNRLEAVFLSMMIPHHQGALEMAALIPDRSSRQELKDLGLAIIASQSAEIDSMNAWLAAWYGL